MYNANQKQEFILQFTKSPTVAKQSESIFNKIGEIEKKHGADMCFISDPDTVLEIAQCVSGSRVNGNKWKLNMLKGYIEWCSKRYDNVELALMNISQEDINISYIENHMASDPNDMKDYLDAFLRPDEKLTMDIVYKCVLWLAYAGIKEEKIIDIKTDDVNLELVGDIFYIIYDDKVYPVPEVALDTFTKCVQLTAFNYEYNLNTKLKPRVSGNGLLRGIKAQSNNYHAFIERITRKASDAGIQRRITYTNAMYSGFFYRMYALELISKVDVDFRDEARRFIGDKVYKVDSTKSTQESIKGQMIKQLEEDYRIWKVAFKKQ